MHWLFLFARNWRFLSATEWRFLPGANNNITYVYNYTKQVNNMTVNESIEYSLSIKEKNENNLIGYIHKKSFLHYKDFDKNQKEIISKRIQNTETSAFYYDIFREMVSYQRTIRFGYKEFLFAFEGILNSACTAANLDYSFTVSQYTEGLNIDDIKRTLQNEAHIQKLKIKYQMPNPDADILKQIRENPEKTINDFRAANLAIKHVTYQAFSDTGLNINSEIIEAELQNINTIHSNIGAQKATQNGYVEVETTDINGVTRSTTDARPVIRHIDNISQLEEAASTVIVNYIRNSIMD